jgi:hypothetical protein
MRRQPFYDLDGFPEALMAVVFGIIIWGSYGFPHVAKVMLGSSSWAASAHSCG